jgi:hypothetical protein
VELIETPTFTRQIKDLLTDDDYWEFQSRLLYAYPKNVTADLSPKQVAQLAKAVKEEFGNEAESV